MILKQIYDITKKYQEEIKIVWKDEALILKEKCIDEVNKILKNEWYISKKH